MHGELVDQQQYCCCRWYAWRANLWCPQTQFQCSRLALQTLNHATFPGIVLWSCLCCSLAHTIPCLLLGPSLYLLPHATQRMVVAPAQICDGVDNKNQLLNQQELVESHVTSSQSYVYMIDRVELWMKATTTSLKLSSRLILVLSISSAVFSLGLSWYINLLFLICKHASWLKFKSSKGCLKIAFQEKSILHIINKPYFFSLSRVFEGRIDDILRGNYLPSRNNFFHSGQDIHNHRVRLYLLWYLILCHMLTRVNKL